MQLRYILLVVVFVSFFLTITGYVDYIDEDEYLEDDDHEDYREEGMTFVEPAATERNLNIKKKMAPILTHPPVRIGVFPPPVQVPVIVETHRIIKELSCSFGMILIGRQCIGRQITPIQFVCPPHTRLMNGECNAMHRPVAKCPEGYDQQRDSCQKCEMFPAKFSCPNEDEEVDGSTCVRHLPVPPQCPPGFLMREDQCIQTVPSSIQCPAEFVLSSNSTECIRSWTSVASTVCPDGADLNKITGKCIIVKQDPPKCPKKFSFCPKTERCVRHVNEVPTPCPTGYQPAGTACQRSSSTPAQVFCHSDYKFDGVQTCMREVAVQPRCPNGYQHSRAIADQCEKIVREVPVCPSGTIQVPGDTSGLCERRVELDFIRCCSPGFELVGNKCERLETLTPKLSCEENCYQRRITRLAFACAENSQFIDDVQEPKCVEESSDHCIHSTYQPPARCMADSTLRASSFGADGLAAIDPECKPPTTTVPNCTPKKEVTLAQPYCPEGGKFEDGQCVINDPIIPDRICEVGELDEYTGKCIRKITAPVKDECPSGSFRHDLGCLVKEQVQPDFVCPEGSESGPNGACVLRTDFVISTPSVEHMPSSYYCDTGRLAEDGKTCVVVESVPLKMACPVGTQPSEDESHRCIVTAEMIVPAPVERTVKSSYVCSNGSRSTGPTCNEQETVPAVTICPADASPVGNGEQCVRGVPAIESDAREIVSVAIPVCPAWAASRGTTCVAMKKLPFHLECSEEYHLRDDSCYRSVPMQTVCPAGTIETAEGCLRETISVPLERIVQGCVHFVSSSCTGCPRSVTSECHGI